MDERILYLSRSEVEVACQELDSVAIIREVFRLHGNGATSLPDEAYLAWHNSRGEVVRSLNMPGYLGGEFRAAGTKIINSNPANVERRMHRASGVTILFDEESTRIRCIMDAAYISALRTASVTMLAVELLRNSTLATVGLIGAGAIAAMHVELLVRSMPEICAIRIYDRNLEASERLAAMAQATSNGRELAIQITNSAKEAVCNADLVIPATTTVVGYIPFCWIQPGAVLVNVSLEDVLPEVALNADLLIVDDWNLVKADERRLIGRMYRSGQIVGPDAPQNESARRVDATLGDLVTGRAVGRTSSKQVVFVNPFGLAIEDIALAQKVYEIALTRRLGSFISR
jgi:N-[(2S)-2-amino-2-carboxyethyl]-L-glutamate dehydrogenase